MAEVSTRNIIRQIKKAISERQSEIRELTEEDSVGNGRLITYKRVNVSSLEWVLSLCQKTEAESDGLY